MFTVLLDYKQKLTIRLMLTVLLDYKRN